MTEPADELRTAAATLRELAAAATPGPWEQGGIGDYGWTVDFNRPDSGVETGDSDQGRADADYIATMHPGVGSALAGWLDAAAADAREIGANLQALAVARAINGTAG